MTRQGLQVVGLWAVLAMAGCGGGGGSDGPSGGESISGMVIDGPIAGATVCLDLNGDGTCGAGEAASAKTDAAGRYTITGLTAEQLASGAALIAMVPADAIDADNPGSPIGTAYVMRAPGGKGTLISPITTLVQAGVDQGMALADAERAVALQLRVEPDSLYDDYSSNPTDPGNVVLAAAARDLIVPTLKAGAALEVMQSQPADTAYYVADFWFDDTANWYLRYLKFDASADDQGLLPYTDQRIWYENGALVPDQRAYNLDTQAFRLTGNGWIQCERATVHRDAPGNPSYGEFCGDVSPRTRVVTDISGQSIKAIVTQIQAAPVNILRAVDPAAFGSAVFPEGSVLSRRIARVSEYSIRYSPLDGSLGATVAELVQNVGIPEVPSSANTVSIASLRNSSGAIVKRVRVAFGPNGFAQYYLCDVVNNASVNCAASSSGTYASTTIHGTPAITFTEQPSADGLYAASEGVLVERDGRTWYGYRVKPDTATNEAFRLNHVAFGAIAAALGIQAPAP